MKRALAPWLLGALLAATGAAQAGPAEQAPELASGLHASSTAQGSRHMVVTANAHASAAALDILHQGGSAVDATIAAQLVLGLVEPQSSGIGGGLFLLHWDTDHKRLSAIDGRETAPGRMPTDSFLDANGSPQDFWQAAIGGASVGVPGTLAALELAHQQHGKLPWARLFEPAIALAEGGFPVSPRLHTLLVNTPVIDRHPSFKAAYLAPDGSAPAIGSILRNPAYAHTLRTLARDGARAFYQGPLADRIAEAVQRDPLRPGSLRREDLASYRAIERPAVCAPFRQYTVCSAPPPAGGVPMLELLGLLERAGYPGRHPLSAQALHLFSEASRLVYADRDAYMADPDFIAVPAQELLSASYLDQRARHISATRSSGAASPGLPRLGLRATPAPELPATTHLSIADAEGNIVSMTSSIEAAFGSRIVVEGFILNNQLTDFAFSPNDSSGRPVANRAAPGKRPRSAMSPTIAFDADGRPVLALGSPGGSRIIDYVARTTALTLNGMPLAAAIESPHIADVGKGLELEPGRFSTQVAEELERRGHATRENDQTSGLQGIHWRGDIMEGAADPRREGRAIGD